MAKLLDVCPGVTAIIGGGGKTTLLRALGEELAKHHRVLLCTTTKMFPYADLPCARTREELERLRKEHPLLCAGTDVPGTGKIAAPPIEIETLAEWFDYVLVEADGSAQRPLKAHAAHEPVIPNGANQRIYVVGASGFGKPVCDAAHRPELYAELAGVSVGAEVTPEIAAAVLMAEALYDRIYVNQVDELSGLAEAQKLAALLNCPVLAGSLQKGEYTLC